jgi:hypothetical protein
LEEQGPNLRQIDNIGRANPIIIHLAFVAAVALLLKQVAALKNDEMPTIIPAIAPAGKGISSQVDATGDFKKCSPLHFNVWEGSLFERQYPSVAEGSDAFWALDLHQPHCEGELLNEVPDSYRPIQVLHVTPGKEQSETF